jgi:purine-binding chemotaxis protein CheW
MEKVKQSDEPTVDSTKELAGKYLLFKVGDEEYGLQILKVQEIIRMQKVTTVPKTPEFVRGIINLRERVIPIIELRLKFGMEAIEDTDKTCIVVVQVKTGDTAVVMGIIIDDVREVRDILKEEIDKPPSFGTADSAEFIMGIGKLNNRVIMLLDSDMVLSQDEVINISTIK